MVGNVTIQGQIVGTATFDGAKISANVTIAPPINATVVFGGSGVTVHNSLTGRDVVDSHPIEAITDLPETLQGIVDSIPDPIWFTPENEANKKTTLTNSETDYPSTSAVNRLSELKQTDSPEFANTQITTLKSVTAGGVIPDLEATYIGATAKSVLSYLTKIISKLFSLDGRVAALEDDIIYELTLSAAVQNFTISLDKNNNALSISECRLILITPSATTANFLFRINGIMSAVYNGMAANGSTSFTGSFGQDGSVCDVRLMYDSSLNMVSFSGLTARKYPTNLFQTVPISGFTNPGSVTTKITSITLLTNTGLFAVGTKIVLKKK